MNNDILKIRLGTLNVERIKQYTNEQEIILSSRLYSKIDDNYNSILVVKSDTNALLLNKFEEWKFNCFKIGNCADYAIVKLENTLYNSLYIFEFKKNISINSCSTIHDQFIGAYLRAIMVTSYLSINIHKVYLYVIYCKEDIDYNQLKVSENLLSVPSKRMWINSWLNKDDQVVFTYQGQDITFSFRQIKLDANSKDYLEIFNQYC